MKYLLCYDIKSGKRLRKVAKIMEGTGYRVQKSVFEAFLTAEQLGELTDRLTALLEEEEDTIRIYRLCESCNKEIRILGAGDEVTIPPYIII